MFSSESYSRDHKSGHGRRRGRRRQRGVTLMLGTISLVFVLPMVGLAIDVGYLYAVKTRLQSAVDGAALAAARALVLGQNTTIQRSAAQQNAVNWFYANFPDGSWGTSSVGLTTSDVAVYDDSVNPNLRRVDVTANTAVPTFFMRWLRFESTNISAVGHASRRDVVMMIVLDRSSSMELAGVCGDMKDAAKLFTGQFAPGRDRIGLVSYSDGTYVHSAPVTDFQTTLGYTGSYGSGTGEIDTIQCKGGTNTAQAISIGYNELYKVMQPGALNLILLETDGLPNSMTMRWFDSTANQSFFHPSSGCLDANNKTTSGGGWRVAGSEREWITESYTFGIGSPFTDPAPGAYGVFYTRDDAQGFRALGYPWHTRATQGLNDDAVSTYNVPGCAFRYNPSSPNDFQWMPATDIFGNEVAPANAYMSVTTGTNGWLNMQSSMVNQWENFRAGAFNAADNAAYRVRTNATLPAFVFTIGLGGGTVPPDYTLLQRMANDPNGDQFNTPALYADCAVTAGCVHYPDQPSSTFIFSTDENSLRQAFIALSSQILRLAQ